jgi:3-polyprenyl-4-hydroxybenzoate decarboxylase
MAEIVPVQDLHSFLQLLEDEGELATIESSVDLNQEIGAVCLRIILDPSLPRGEQRPPLTSKMIIDATRYDAKDFAPVCLPAADTMAKVERQWSRYGIPAR